jgi:hypothetical protein
MFGRDTPFTIIGTKAKIRKIQLWKSVLFEFHYLNYFHQKDNNMHVEQLINLSLCKLESYSTIKMNVLLS